MDFGTATTFDAISAKGEFLGGAIAPGLGISADALFTRAARLPRVDIRKPAKVIGTGTVDNLQIGLYYGYIGLVDGILERMIAELGPDTRTIATGGLARLIAAGSKYIRQVDELLTLTGLRTHLRAQPGPPRPRPISIDMTGSLSLNRNVVRDDNLDKAQLRFRPSHPHRQRAARYGVPPNMASHPPYQMGLQNGSVRKFHWRAAELLQQRAGCGRR